MICPFPSGLCNNFQIDIISPFWPYLCSFLHEAPSIAVSTEEIFNCPTEAVSVPQGIWDAVEHAPVELRQRIIAGVTAEQCRLNASKMFPSSLPRTRVPWGFSLTRSLTVLHCASRSLSSWVSKGVLVYSWVGLNCPDGARCVCWHKGKYGV